MHSRTQTCGLASLRKLFSKCSYVLMIVIAVDKVDDEEDTAPAEEEKEYTYEEVCYIYGRVLP